MTYREQDKAESQGKVIDIFVLGQMIAMLAIALVVQLDGLV